MTALHPQALLPQPVQQLEGAIRRLGNAVQIQKAETTVERHGWEIILLKNVGESPETIRLGRAARLQGAFGREGRGVGFVLARVAWVGRGVPFRVQERPAPRLARR